MWLTGGIVSRLSGGILGTTVAMTAASTSHGRQQWPWLTTHSNSSREEGIHVHTNLGNGPCYLSFQGLLSVSGSGKILVILVGSSSQLMCTVLKQGRRFLHTTACDLWLQVCLTALVGGCGYIMAVIFTHQKSSYLHKTIARRPGIFLCQKV